MKYVLIFAKTPYDLTPYDRWLESTNVTPIVLCAGAYAESYSSGIKDVYSFDDFETNPLVIQTADQLLSEKQVVAIFARAESDILRAAMLREKFGVPGQTTESAELFRDKFKMKKALAGKILTPTFRKVTSFEDAADFAFENGFPVVIKPVAESGSSGVEIVRDRTELEHLRKIFSASCELMIETFIEGRMYHVDGLVLSDKIVVLQPSVYINGCLAFRENQPLGSVLLSPQHESFSILDKATRAVLAAMPTPRHTAFHAEFWITPNNEVVFCEIASRTGGAMIASLFEAELNIRLDREWLLAELGLPSEVRFQYRPCGWVIFQPKRGRLLKLASQPPAFVTSTRTTARIGETYGGGVKSGLFLSGYVVQGSDEDSIAETIQTLSDWFEQETLWEPA